MNPRRACLLATLGLLLAACAAASDEPQPPEMAYGQDLCAACGMLIDQPQLAAATLGTDGEVRKFDEIGDMLQYHAEHPTAQVRAWFVHDYGTEAWVRAEDAHFVLSTGAHTPMGHGMVAFAASEEAADFAQEQHVEVLSFDEARAALLAMDHASH